MIRIPESLINKLPPERKMDYILIDVKLSNGTIMENIVVRGNSQITGFLDDKNPEELNFKSSDIVSIRKSSFLMRLLRLW